MNRVIIIAEAGVNHNGDVSIAKELIDAAAAAGADYIKFQTFIAELNISPSALKAEYQSKNMGGDNSQLEMVKKLQLSLQDHIEIIDYCKVKNIKFATTAFDPVSQDMLKDFDLDFIKIPSGEITNLPYLRRSAKMNRPLYLSTGMANLDEIEAALNVLISEGASKEDIIVLHCNTEYPTPLDDVNLLAMLQIKEQFGVDIGYSDHTLGVEVPIAAVALGAKVIEKHLTLNRNLPGPDHRASLEPNELKEMVRMIRNIELTLSGSGVKEPSKSEKKNLEVARKSIHLIVDLKRGDILTEECLIMLRPGDGISPMNLDEVIGKRVNNNLTKGHKLTKKDFN